MTTNDLEAHQKTENAGEIALEMVGNMGPQVFVVD